MFEFFDELIKGIRVVAVSVIGTTWLVACAALCLLLLTILSQFTVFQGVLSFNSAFGGGGWLAPMATLGLLIIAILTWIVARNTFFAERAAKLKADEADRERLRMLARNQTMNEFRKTIGVILETTTETALAITDIEDIENLTRDNMDLLYERTLNVFMLIVTTIEYGGTSTAVPGYGEARQPKYPNAVRHAALLAIGRLRLVSGETGSKLDAQPRFYSDIIYDLDFPERVYKDLDLSGLVFENCSVNAVVFFRCVFLATRLEFKTTGSTIFRECDCLKATFAFRGGTVTIDKCRMHNVFTSTALIGIKHQDGLLAAQYYVVESDISYIQNLAKASFYLINCWVIEHRYPFSLEPQHIESGSQVYSSTDGSPRDIGWRYETYYFDPDLKPGNWVEQRQ